MRVPLLIPGLLFSLFLAPGILAFGQKENDSSLQWKDEIRLTFQHSPAKLTYNFARSIAVDDSGRVHIVWYDARTGNEQVYYNHSRDGGATWEKEQCLSSSSVHMETDPLLPALAVSGKNVYVVWHQIHSQRLDIFLRRSSDGGATWGEAIRLSSGPGSSAHASIAASGPEVHVVWGERTQSVRPDGEQAEIYYKRSTNWGATWEQEKRLTDLPFDSWVPCVAASGQNVYLAWVDTRDGNEEEYFKRSTNGGVTWGADTRLTRNSGNSWAPSVAVSGKTVHLIWFDQKDSPAQPLEVEEKLDQIVRLLGLQVNPAPRGVMVPHPEGAAKKRAESKLKKIQEEAPAWAQHGGDARKLQVIMEEFQQMMRGERIPSYAEKEKKLDQALNLMGLSFAPEVEGDLPKIYYLQALGMRVQEKMKKIQEAAPGWVHRGGNPKQLEALLKNFESQMSLATSEWDIYYRRSTDGGASWGPEIRLTSAPGSSQRPSIAVDGEDLHVVWFDNRDGNFEVYYKESPDGGITWEPDLRLTSDPGDSLHPTVAASKKTVHLIWFDERNGSPEIYYKRKVR